MNKKKVIIFGTGDLAQIVHFYLKHDRVYEIICFTLSRKFIKSKSFENLPVIAFEEIEQHYPPEEFEMCIAIGYSKMNKIRQKFYEEAKAKGYKLISYISPGTTVYENVKIGDNCLIFENNIIQPFAEIGNNVVIWSGNIIGHHSKIMDHNFISLNVVIAGRCLIKENCFLGVNAAIKDHIIVEQECVIGPGALIKKNTEKKGVYSAKATDKRKLTSDRLKTL